MEQHHQEEKVVFLDVESTDLYGEPFCVSACTSDGIEQILLRWEPAQAFSEFVKKNVLPALEGIPVTHSSRAEALFAFAKWWLPLKKDGYTICTHMGHPVESRFLLDLFAENSDILGIFDGPYPLLDTSSMLHVLGFQSDSEQAFLRERDPGFLERLEKDYSAHDPRFDAKVTARAYELLMSIATTKK